MSIQIRQGGDWRSITRCSIFSAGSWRNIRAVKVYSDGAWRDVANFTVPVSGMTLTTNPVGSFTRSGRNVSSLSQTVSVSPSGGLAPYTYNWEVVSQIGSAGTVSVPLPSTATTSVRCTFTDYDTVECVIRVTVTDTLGSSATADLDGSFTRLEPISTGGTA